MLEYFFQKDAYENVLWRWATKILENLQRHFMDVLHVLYETFKKFVGIKYARVTRFSLKRIHSTVGYPFALINLNI